MNATILQGDCLQILRRLAPESVHAVVTDPPSGTGFMGQEWDKDKGGREEWIAWLSEVMTEALRVLKPGAHALVWALPRTSHWTAMALENAGFEIRDVITHHFGTGFPKSKDISKAIDETQGAEREVVAMVPQRGAKFQLAADHIDNGGFNDPERTEFAITAPATPEAKEWDGWGTAIKPASEHWILVRKPLSESSIARNVLEHGTGALNIGACRIGDEVLPPQEAGQSLVGTFERQGMLTPERIGRWPANVVFTHSSECEEECAEGCPVRMLDEQSGVRKSGKMKAGQVRPGIGYSGGLGTVVASDTYGDEGGASRFFYVAKPSPREKNAGLDHLDERTTNDGRNTPIDNPFQRGETARKNHHPTVKPVELMRYLCRLITPPGGIVLDCFLGSGTTGVAALHEGFSFVGLEQSPEYCEIARLRMAAVPRPLPRLIAL